ncbi:hypothetical protein POM88_033442 [Heracleum sosnowskyi]|uniref:DUF7081 domain-containing protein n=1 Tax=Heracleum sosnowskyi TaxID=360622 RepID=A0AAD8I2F5_9APIA|nr:hypothetical protein POM88_033442 [Heracleum sosnowskyi]
MKQSDALGSVTIEGKSGVGLPYAPEDWPNPGDVWTWKLGKRISPDGFYRDRCLFLPPRLHQKGKRKYFDSKKSIITFLSSKFPETNIDAFFESFTWKVPVSEKAQVTPRPRKVHPRSKSDRIGETAFTRRSWTLVTSKASSRKRLRYSPIEVKDIVDLSSWSNGIRSCELTGYNSKSATGSKNIQASSSQNTGSQSSKDGTCCHILRVIPSTSIPNDSDMLIDSADNLLSQSLPKSSVAVPVNDQSATSQEKMFEAQIKLLLLFATDIPVMHSSIKLPEILHLWSLLKTDPNISATRYGILKLKLIDEIPLAWKEFQENKKISEAAGKLSEDLESNIVQATTLVNEYNESKGYEYILHKELDSISRDIEKIDEQISALQSRRDELASAADVKKKAVAMLISKQKKAAECLSKVVREVEMGKKRRQEWELKKKMSEEQKAKILSKFDPLGDFCLQTF